MKNTTVNIPFNEEKLNATRYFTGQKGINVEDELGKALDKLYEKCVPAPTREYIEQLSGGKLAAPTKPKRNQGKPSDGGRIANSNSQLAPQVETDQRKEP